MSDHVTIHHPKTKGVAHVPRSAVTAWLRAGWERVEEAAESLVHTPAANPAPQTPAETPEPQDDPTPGSSTTE